MTRDETLALWRKTDEARAAALAEGKTVEQANELAVLIWNSWAKEMISKREELQRQGLWKIGRGEWGKQEPQNTETHIWLQEAWADFAGVRFDGGHIKSQNADFSFGGFMFPGGASFESAEFSKGANFLAARFDGDADFDHAVFRDAANLREVQFFWKAAFAFVTFVGWTSFINSIFYERSRFSGSQFQSMADFSNVQFRSPRVLSFRRTIFRQAALFRHARFLGGLADFRGMSAEHAFDITYAQFEKLPWFNQANFKEAPDFDQVLYPIPSFLSSLLYHRRETSIDPNVFPNSTLTEEDYDRYNATIAISPSYRALRRLAIQ